MESLHEKAHMRRCGVCGAEPIESAGFQESVLGLTQDIIELLAGYEIVLKLISKYGFTCMCM